MHREHLLLGLMLLWGAGGCGVVAETVPVTGRVEIAGQQADDISVQFVPDSADGKPGFKASGVTDGAGRFTLHCEDGRAGAVPGRYRVLLDDLKVYANPRGDVPAAERKQLIAPRFGKKYRAVVSTPLKITVEPSAPEITLEVKP